MKLVHVKKARLAVVVAMVVDAGAVAVVVAAAVIEIGVKVRQVSR